MTLALAKTLPILLGLSAALASVTALALPTDRDQPIHIQADSSQLDDKQGVAVYTGDVIITQGTMKITGNKVTVTRDDNGDVKTFTSVGNLAYYEQKPAVNKPIVQAWAVTIDYLASQDRIILTDRAKVVNDGNVSTGEKIVYDTVKQIANAGRGTGSKITAPQPRIDMVIQPKKKTDQPQKAQ
ncbi:lipopolysaccharide transport periplasmic protein LptA [Pseudomonas typographi]|uniref:Lipopolysaccharide export system protein LptA n=1 Tax=Pseudomonas typographi TaxID=2715964 RepID=A0ABR7YW84_9PSED|nr:lipopolysaccharide transport periplasmic protein LptA [Pseudomonas typographi]MBD1553326.1 lipopolysaccharide transport periplasmic protein LptA [Pseudomonas typographi]MBD1585691.1 lipopolysaccharide transport periplasmic protein LptA [Pseudomonas typographi]MBD1597396.1 lipopolysaccharide transport periplasmic protein LptA [Pseudomonas typographi]